MRRDRLAPDLAASDGQPAPRSEPDSGERPRSIMRDVARAAGVSHQTVSRVLNGHPGVGQETRQRVLAAMRELNYRAQPGRPHARHPPLRHAGHPGLCGSDQIALGVVRALQEAGRQVPADVSVVGSDDTPDSGRFLPPLTTIHQDFAELGRRSLGILLDRLDPTGKPSMEHVHLPPNLVVRASTARVRGMGR